MISLSERAIQKSRQSRSDQISGYYDIYSETRLTCVFVWAKLKVKSLHGIKLGNLPLYRPTNRLRYMDYEGLNIDSPPYLQF